MGLMSKIISQKEPEQKSIIASDLTKEELELLLKILANADIKGRDVEFFYTMVIKLQNMYIACQNNKQ